MSKDIRFIREECCDIWNNLKDKTKMIDYLIESKQRIAELEAKLAESEKRIQAYEEIVEQKDEELNFANRDKTCIIKQLNDPKAYVLLEDYKRIEQQLAEKENTITTLIEDSKASKELLKKEIEELKEQRHIYLTRSVEECNKITDLELELQHKDEEIAYLTKQVKRFNN